MKILIASDFYAEYELYETNNPEHLKQHIAELVNGDDIVYNEHFECIGNQDTMDTQEAIAQADEVVFISDLIDE